MRRRVKFTVEIERTISQDAYLKAEIRCLQETLDDPNLFSFEPYETSKPIVTKVSYIPQPEPIVLWEKS